VVKEFTKSNLENRMVVELRNGSRCLVVDNRLLGKSGYLFLTEEYEGVGEYNEDLKFPSDSKWDIIKVYQKVNQRSFDNDPECLILLWERQEIKEITMTEIEEKFGCKVKIVND